MTFEPSSGPAAVLLSPEYVVIDAGLLVGYLAHEGHHYFASVELPPFVADVPGAYGTAVHFARVKSMRAITDMLNLTLSARRLN